MEETIFVSLGSYRDIDTINTIDDLFKRASNPKNIIVGLFLQDTRVEITKLIEAIENKPYRENIKIQTIDWKLSKGCMWARDIILKTLYTNETYFLQIDAHCRFINGWDEKYIKLYKNIPSKGVLSIFPPNFEFNQTYDEYTSTKDGNIYIYSSPTWIDDPSRKVCMRHPKYQYEKVPSLSGSNLFGEGSIVDILKVDNYYEPTKEQEIYSLLLFKSGYDIFATKESLVYHKYNHIDEPIYEGNYRELNDWGRFNPNREWYADLIFKGGEERTSQEWYDWWISWCDVCKKDESI